MMEEKVLSRKSVSLTEVKELLREREKEGELSYEQGLTLKYADKFSHLSSAKLDKLIEELKKIEGMTEDFAIKLADVLPDTKELLALMVPKNCRIPNEKHEEIIKIIKKYFERTKAYEERKKKKK